MPGSIGEARSNDIVPNGGIIPIVNFTTPGSISLSTILSNLSLSGNASILNIIGSASWNASTLAANPTTGVFHASATEIYLPVNGQDVIYFGGVATLSATLYTTQYA